MTTLMLVFSRRKRCLFVALIEDCATCVCCGACQKEGHVAPLAFRMSVRFFLHLTVSTELIAGSGEYTQYLCHFIQVQWCSWLVICVEIQMMSKPSKDKPNPKHPPDSRFHQHAFCTDRLRGTTAASLQLQLLPQLVALLFRQGFRVIKDGIWVNGFCKL